MWKKGLRFVYYCLFFLIMIVGLIAGIIIAMDVSPIFFVLVMLAAFAVAFLTVAVGMVFLDIGDDVAYIAKKMGKEPGSAKGGNESRLGSINSLR